MTDVAEDSRTIARDAPQYNASLVRREDATESLASFWVRFDGDPTPFEPGQYMTIGVFADPDDHIWIVHRPGSLEPGECFASEAPEPDPPPEQAVRATRVPASSNRTVGDGRRIGAHPTLGRAGPCVIGGGH